MANIVRIELKSEQVASINSRTKEITLQDVSDTIEVYVACDGISAWVGTISIVNSWNELLDLVGPENLRDSLDESLSCDELEIIDAALFCSDYKYMIGDDWFEMVEH